MNDMWNSILIINKHNLYNLICYMLGRWPGPISFFNHDSVARTYVYSSKGHETFAVHFEQLGKTNDL